SSSAAPTARRRYTAAGSPGRRAVTTVGPWGSRVRKGTAVIGWKDPWGGGSLRVLPALGGGRAVRPGGDAVPPELVGPEFALERPDALPLAAELADLADPLALGLELAGDGGALVQP